jgi:hypothetical protein
VAVIDFKEAKRLYEAGMSQGEVAIELGTSQKVIWSLFRKNGYKSRPAAKRNQYGQANASWKGSAAGYQAFHRRLDATKGRPKKCEVCGIDDPKRVYDWANLTGKLDEPSDYKRMCRSCHSKYDSKALNFKGGHNLCR